MIWAADMTRVDELNEPPVFGQMYLVRCAWHYRREMWVPIRGLWHEDKEFLNFDRHHYHVDWRFVDAEMWQKLTGVYDVYRSNFSESAIVIEGAGNDEPPVEVQPFRCVVESNTFPFYHWSKTVQRNFESAFADKRLVSKTCPHRGYDLTSTAIVDGCVTCPLHGLKWNAETGCLVKQAI